MMGRRCPAPDAVAQAAADARPGEGSRIAEVGESMRIGLRSVALLTSLLLLGTGSLASGATTEAITVSTPQTKFNIVKGVLKDRVVVIVDDSIVRGTTSKQLVQLVKQAEPKEVHFRVTAPPIMYPCHYGMDFPTQQELIAFQKNGDIQAIAEELGVDSLGYMTIEELLSAAPHEAGENYCTACFSGKYPTAVDPMQSKEEHEG